MAATRDAIDKLTSKGVFGGKRAEASRVNITRWLDGDKSVKLSPEEQKAADLVQDVKTHVGNEAIKAGVFDDFLGRLHYSNI